MSENAPWPPPLKSIVAALQNGVADRESSTPWQRAPISQADWDARNFDARQLQLQTFYWQGWKIRPQG